MKAGRSRAEKIKAFVGILKTEIIGLKKKNKVRIIIMFKAIIILNENLIKLEIFLYCLFSKYSGMSFGKVEEKPRKLIEFRKRAKFMEVAIIPVCSGSKNLPTINQKMKPKRLTTRKWRKR